jgi:putative ABC transport system permease protein
VNALASPSALTRKLMRDVWRLRGQVASIAAVVACGVMMAVSMHGTLRSVERSVNDYYGRRHRWRANSRTFPGWSRWRPAPG